MKNLDLKYILIVVLVVVVILLAIAAKGGYTSGMTVLKKNYQNDMSKPRGIRNNNPGNLRISSSNWLGKVSESENTDGAFEQFNEYKYGVRAMTKLLKNYINDGFNTVPKIVNRYAPAGDGSNDPAQYIGDIATKSGIMPHEVLTTDKETLGKLVKSMSEIENGQLAVTTLQFNEGYALI